MKTNVCFVGHQVHLNINNIVKDFALKKKQKKRKKNETLNEGSDDKEKLMYLSVSFQSSPVFIPFPGLVF